MMWSMKEVSPGRLRLRLRLRRRLRLRLRVDVVDEGGLAAALDAAAGAHEVEDLGLLGVLREPWLRRAPRRALGEAEAVGGRQQ